MPASAGFYFRCKKGRSASKRFAQTLQFRIIAS